MRKLVDEQLDEGSDVRLTTSTVYERIKRSNSSLNRKGKKLLEDSIERVLEVVKADMQGNEEESIEGDFEGLEEKTPVPVGLEHPSPRVMYMLREQGIKWSE